MLQIGSLIDGKYKILSIIGQGGMSTVYLAINERANKPWAIKEVRKNGVKNYEVVKQSLVMETDMLKQLSHPYLPSIVDVIDTDECFLIVMDYIEGNTLYRTLAEYGAQPQDKVIEWAKELCNVLSYLHTRTQPIIYRDLKPANIMLKPDGTITLIDFGTARTYKQDSIEDTTCLGTRGYAAPEQFGGRGQTDERTDIYNLGATLYHLVTGHNPCEAPYEMYPIRQWNPSLSAGLEKIILKCTQLNPKDRYQSSAEVMYDLEHYSELDKNYRKRARLRVAMFGITSFITVFSAAAAAYFMTSAGKIRNESYDTYLEEARSRPEVSQQIEKYEEAISLDPTDGTAFIELLNQSYLMDDVFTPEEEEQLRKLLITKYDDKRTYEQMLSTNPEAYDEFAYRLALAYFYCYDGAGNKPMSTKWFNIAMASETLDEVKVGRAQRLGKIASYYSDIGRTRPSGDEVVSYAQYWEDMVEITTGDIATQDNTTTALMVYKEMVAQINKHATKFKKAGITYEEMMAQLDNISNRLETDIIATAEDEDRINPLKQNLYKNLDLAYKAVEGAFSKE